MKIAPPLSCFKPNCGAGKAFPLAWTLFPLAWTLAALIFSFSSASLSVANAQTKNQAANSDHPQIGKTVSVKKRVTGAIDAQRRRLKKGDRIHLNEIIETSAKGHGEFILNDNTKLAVSAKSRLTLDKFIYNPKKKSGEIIVNATKGAFRFISGKSGSSAYKIKTPVASIAVRGTIFDGYVTDDGDVAVLLVKGAIDVCGVGRKCRRLNQRGRFFHIRPNGRVIGPLKWDGTFLRGVDFALAFPFIGRRLVIDPVRRLRRSTLYGGRLLKRTIRKPGRVIRKIYRKRPRILGR